MDALESTGVPGAAEVLASLDAACGDDGLVLGCQATAQMVQGGARSAMPYLESAADALHADLASGQGGETSREVLGMVLHNLGVAQLFSGLAVQAQSTLLDALRLGGVDVLSVFRAGGSANVSALPTSALGSLRALAWGIPLQGVSQSALVRAVERLEALSQGSALVLPRAAELQLSDDAAAAADNAAALAMASRAGECTAALFVSDRQGGTAADVADRAFSKLARCPCSVAAAASALVSAAPQEEPTRSLERAALGATLAWAANASTGLGALTWACTRAGQEEARGDQPARAAGVADPSIAVQWRWLRTLACTSSSQSVWGSAAFSAAYHGSNDASLKHALSQLATRLALPDGCNPAEQAAASGSAWPFLTPASAAALSPFTLPLSRPKPRPAAAAGADEEPAYAAPSSPSGSVHTASGPGPSVQRRPVRVCFITAFPDRHSVSKVALPLVLGLAASPAFDVVAVLADGTSATGDAAQALERAEEQGLIALVKLPPTLSAHERGSAGTDRLAVRQLQCDAVVYPELGMSARVLSLAAARLAPLQLVTHGHSTTSGFSDTIDGFVSLDEAEVAGPGESAPGWGEGSALRFSRLGRAGAAEPSAQEDGGWWRYTEQLVRIAGAHSPFWEAPPLIVDSDEADEAAAAAAAFAGPGARASPEPPSEVALASHHDGDVFNASKAVWAVSDLANIGSITVPEAINATEVRIVAGSIVAALERQVAVPSTLRSERPDGSPQRRPRVLVPQAIAKIHPDGDAAILSMVLSEAKPIVQLLMPDALATARAVSGRFVSRLRAAVQAEAGSLGFSLPSQTPGPGSAPLPEAGAAPELPHTNDAPSAVSLGVELAVAHLLSHVRFLPQRGHTAFLRLLASADVVLDTYPFGGCTSTMEALLQGTPVVSLPHGTALSGRFSQAVLSAAGLHEWAVRSREELVARALTVAESRAAMVPAARRSGRAALAQRVRAVLLSPLAMREWSQVLMRAVRGAWAAIAAPAAPAHADAAEGARTQQQVLQQQQQAGAWGLRLDVASDGGWDTERAARVAEVQVAVAIPEGDEGSDAALCMRASLVAPKCVSVGDLSAIEGQPGHRLAAFDVVVRGPCAAACSGAGATKDMGCVCDAVLGVDVAVVDVGGAVEARPLAVAAVQLSA